ncbi:MAG TPA: hypothetical protein VFI73_13360 [Candidatus Nitrosopolaris sp.]|nr:hypothetical protein [Candidatus Nitrosopolaris sp.]
MDISGQYTKEIQEQLKYTATWLPNVRISLGDVGTLQDHEFHPQGNLSDFGIAFETSEGTGQAEFDYASKDGVSVQVKLVGEAPPLGSTLAQADAGVTIKFGRENAVLFRATRCTSSRIRNINALGRTIIEKSSNNDWQKELAVVTQVISAEGTTIIISHGNNSQIELSAKGKLEPGKVNLADVSADFNISNESNIATRFVAEPNMTPLFEAWGLTHSPWSRQKFVPHGFRDNGLEFGKVGYDDYAST